MDPIHYALPMVVADSRDSYDDGACAADKSLHYGSNGSSKQHDAVQMLVLFAADAFVHKPWLHTVPVNWPLADELHVVARAGQSPMTVSVCESFVVAVEATFVGCRLDVVHDRMDVDADNCWLACPVMLLLLLLQQRPRQLPVTSVFGVLAFSIPFRGNKKFGDCLTECWRLMMCLRWACVAVLALAMLSMLALV